MHELSVASKILNLAVNSIPITDRDTTKIVEIELNIGAMNDYEASWLQKYMDQLSHGTIAEGARLVVNKKPIAFRCEVCGMDFEFEKYGDNCNCPGCGGLKYKMISGRQIEIEKLICQEGE